MPDDSETFYDQTVNNDLVEHLENPVVELEPEPDMQLDWELVSNIQGDKPEPAVEEAAPEDVQKSTFPAPVDFTPAQEDLRKFSWASVTSKNLPFSGAVPMMGTLPHVV